MSVRVPGPVRPAAAASGLAVVAFGVAWFALAWATAGALSAGTAVALAPMAGVLVGVAVALPHRTALVHLGAAAAANVAFEVGVAGRPVVASVLAAGVVGAQALAVGLALRRVGATRLEFRSLRELVRFFLVGVLLAPFGANLAGVAILHAAGVAPGGFDGVVARWAADATGILVLAPLAVTALRRRTGRPRVAGRAGERWIALLLTAASAGVGFGPLWARLPTVLQSPHWMLPPCLWVALRAGVRGARVATAVIAVIVVSGTAAGSGPFAAAAASDIERVRLVQVFLALTSVLTIGAAILTGRLEGLARGLDGRGRALAGAVATISRQRAHLQDVLDTMVEAIVVCDVEGHPDLHNRAAERLPAAWVASGCASAQGEGDGIVVLRPDGTEPFPPDELPVRRALRGLESDRTRLRCRSIAGVSDEVLLETNARTLRGPDGAVRGAVVVWTDVTRVAAAETERVRLLADLQRTLSEVKVLRGILPICSYCQRIRDEGGGWTRLDQFVAERTQASFSHGVCPDCLRRVLASTGG